VVLKREPLGSLKEEFFIPGMEFVPGKNWGGKKLGFTLEKNLVLLLHWFIQHI